jgi:hypothetical protein
MSIDVMKQALDYIKATNKSSSFWLVPASELNKTVTALRLAIEQAEKQEPVAWLWQHSETGRTRIVMPDQIVTTDATWFVVGPLYLGAAPPQRQPLTEAEIESAYMDASCDYISVDDAQAFARAIERAHGIGGGE